VGDDDVVEKIIGDLRAKGIAIDAHGVRREMDRLAAIAMDQISKEVK